MHPLRHRLKKKSHTTEWTPETSWKPTVSHSLSICFVYVTCWYAYVSIYIYVIYFSMAEEKELTVTCPSSVNSPSLLEMTPLYDVRVSPESVLFGEYHNPRQ